MKKKIELMVFNYIYGNNSNWKPSLRYENEFLPLDVEHGNVEIALLLWQYKARDEAFPTHKDI